MHIQIVHLLLSTLYPAILVDQSIVRLIDDIYLDAILLILEAITTVLTS